jgi:DNA-binding IclR family transcriptional regulator
MPDQRGPCASSQWRAPELGYATARALGALELLAFAPRTAPEVAAALAIHPRTARRLLGKLGDEQYATRLPADGRRGYRYRLTPRLLALAAQAATRLPTTNHARAVLHDLSRRHELTALLAVPSYRHVLVLAHHGPAPPGPWQLMPAHATAAGKALLAHRPAWRQSLCAGPLDACANATITAAAELERECADVRRRGYATERDELRPGRRAIAATVPAAGDHAPLAAVSLISESGCDLQDLLGGPLDALTRVADQLARAEAQRTGPLAVEAPRS